MRTRAALLACAVTLTAPAPGSAQDAAMDISRQDILTVLAGMGSSVDQQLKVADIGVGNVAVGILRRNSEQDSGGEHRGLVHVDVSEVYYILSGGGTLMTGGEQLNATEPRDLQPVVGPSYTADSRGGTVRTVWEGVVVIIPAGTVHAWLNIPEEVVYLSIRPDPRSTLPAGYVHPDLGGGR